MVEQELAEAREKITRLEAENEKLRTQVALYVAALKSSKVMADNTWTTFDEEIQVLQERIAKARTITQDIKQSLAALKGKDCTE